MKRWLSRMVLVGALLAVGGFLVAASGVIPIKASSGHWAVTEWFLRFSMKRSLATHSLGIEVPNNLTDPNLVVKGAGHYEIGCRSCHGEPGLPQPRIASRMLPMPPALAPRIRESNPKKLFYVVKHGMKFTGMPAWPSPHRDDEVWAMVAFLLKYPELGPDEYRKLVQREPKTYVPMSLEPSTHPPAAVVESCARCHGGDGLGRGSGAFARLAGQHPEYLRNALEAYASGRRHSGIMGPVATPLTADRIREVAGYYSSLRGPAPSLTDTNAPAVATADIARGETIALHGIPKQRVPACVECHGPGAHRGKPEYPSLAGQSAGYLQLQLTLFNENRRGGSAYAHLMKPVASRLTPEQMGDVTRYFESLASAAPPGD